MSTSKSSWFTNIAGLWRSFISQMDRKSVGNKCPVPWSVSGVVTHGWGLGRRSRSRDGWHVLPALPGNQSVCPGEEEGKEDIQVSWLPAVTGAAGVLSLWQQQSLPPHLEIQQKDRSGHWQEQREKSPRDHNQDEDGGWWCLGAPAAAECALSTWELQPKQERKHYLLQKKVFQRQARHRVCDFTAAFPVMCDSLGPISSSPVSLQHLCKWAKRTPHAHTLLSK